MVLSLVTRTGSPALTSLAKHSCQYSTLFAINTYLEPKQIFASEDVTFVACNICVCVTKRKLLLLLFLTTVAVADASLGVDFVVAVLVFVLVFALVVAVVVC